MALKLRKDIKKSSYYVWFLGAKESKGLRGSEFIIPVIKHLEDREKDVEPFKVTLQVSHKGLKIIQNVVSQGGKNSKPKNETIKHFIPHNTITCVYQQEDVIACILLLFNPVTKCPLHVHAYRCDSLETATLLKQQLQTLIERPENQKKFTEIENRLKPLKENKKVESSLGSDTGTSTRESESSEERFAVETSRISTLYDSVAAELREKLGKNNVPILLPPRDYDTVHRQKGNLTGIELRRCLNTNIVGQNIRNKRIESSGGSSGIGSDHPPSPDSPDSPDTRFNTLDNQSTSDEDWNGDPGESTVYLMHGPPQVSLPRPLKNQERDRSPENRLDFRPEQRFTRYNESPFNKYNNEDKYKKPLNEREKDKQHDITKYLEKPIAKYAENKYLERQKSLERDKQLEKQKSFDRDKSFERDRHFERQKSVDVSDRFLERQKSVDVPERFLERQKIVDVPERFLERQKSVDVSERFLERQKSVDVPERFLERQKSADVPDRFLERQKSAERIPDKYYERENKYYQERDKYDKYPEAERYDRYDNKYGRNDTRKNEKEKPMKYFEDDGFEDSVRTRNNYPEIKRLAKYNQENGNDKPRKYADQPVPKIRQKYITEEQRYPEDRNNKFQNESRYYQENKTKYQNEDTRYYDPDKVRPKSAADKYDRYSRNVDREEEKEYFVNELKYRTKSINRIDREEETKYFEPEVKTPPKSLVEKYKNYDRDDRAKSEDNYFEETVTRRQNIKYRQRSPSPEEMNVSPKDRFKDAKEKFLLMERGRMDEQRKNRIEPPISPVLHKDKPFLKRHESMVQYSSSKDRFFEGNQPKAPPRHSEEVRYRRDIDRYRNTDEYDPKRRSMFSLIEEEHRKNSSEIAKELKRRSYLESSSNYDEEIYHNREKDLRSYQELPESDRYQEGLSKSGPDLDKVSNCKYQENGKFLKNQKNKMPSVGGGFRHSYAEPKARLDNKTGKRLYPDMLHRANSTVSNNGRVGIASIHPY